MVAVFDVPAQKLVEKVALELKKLPELDAPEWTIFVKTGVHKERPPERADWWHIRAASVLRTIYKSGPIGVSKLRSKYGGGKRRGVEPKKFKKASGKIIRTILQRLEKVELIKRVDAGVSKGRIITAKGQAMLDKAAGVISKEMPHVEKIDVAKAKPKEKGEEKKAEKAEVKAEKIEVKEEKKFEKKLDVAIKEKEKAAEVKVETKTEEKPKKEVKA